MLKDDGLCCRGKHSWNVARKLLPSDFNLLSLHLDDIAVELSLVLRALGIVLAGWFCFNSARDRIAGGNIIREIDFDLALRSIERGDKESVGSIAVNMIARQQPNIFILRRIRCSGWRRYGRWRRR